MTSWYHEQKIASKLEITLRVDPKLENKANFKCYLE